MKALAGAALDKFIDQELDIIKHEGIIKDYKKRVNFNHVEYPYDKQFLANFLIETLEKKFIVVRSSNSFRQDRSKIGFYDFDGILKHSEFSKEIIATIYLVPDSELDNVNFIHTREKIKSKEFYCPATHLLSFSEFMSFLEGHKYEVLNSDVDEEEVLIKEEEALALMTAEERGSYYGKKGNSYERHLVSMFSDNRNLRLFREGQLTGDSTFNLVLARILNDNDVNLEDVLKVSATNSVPLLMNGGTPKTDVILIIEVSGNLDIVETLSLKNTNNTRVSCHDYKAFDYIRILKCEGTRLADYFNRFQNNPSAKDFSELLQEGYSVEKFSSLLNDKKEVFNNWVLRGMYDELNLTVPEVQVSNYLLIRKGDIVSFYSMLQYIALISEKSKKVFGVPFGWTYPSKQRGKRIQLKVPVIM